MNKTIINVPPGIRYISEWEDFNLPDFPCIIDKQVTGCGFTEWVINNQFNMVLSSPRLILLENKAEQHLGDVFYARNDLDEVLNVDRDLNRDLSTIVKSETEQDKLKENYSIEENKTKLRKQIKDYYIQCLDENRPCKILVTYDSYRIVYEALNEIGCFDSFYTVVDEFQSIFTDSRFKSSTEVEFLGILQNVNRLCFVSATPMMDEYLEMLPEFKDLPYIELDWGKEDSRRIIKPQLSVHPCKRLNETAVKIIKDYQSGNFEKTIIKDDLGNLREIESKELVIYVNSVKNICDIIKKAGLTYDNTNVLCSKSFDNNKRIRKAFGLGRGDVGGIGKVPLKDEPRKMFTLCTRTVYLGADFYSTCARSVILSDANIECLAVDITLDLPQILGRQRLDCNPWKNRAELYVRFLSNKNYKKVDDFKKHQNLKITRTEKLLSIYNSSTDNDAKHELAKTYLYVAKSKNYKDDYVAVNTHGGSDLIPVFNNLVMVSEFRAFEIQQIDYVDRFRTFSKIQSSEFDLDPSVDIVNNFVNNFNSFTQFPDKMRLLCESKLSETILNAVLSQVPLIYSTLYYSVGPEKMKSLRYRKGEIEDYYKSTALYESNLLLEKINSNFKVGDRLSSIDIKHKLSEIYKELNLMKTAKATDLEKFFLLKDIKIPSTRDGESIRLRGYELLSKKEN